MDMDRTPLTRDEETFIPFVSADTDTDVETAGSDYLDEAQQRAMACLPQQGYGPCGNPNAGPPPPVAPCNDGNVGKITYITAVFPAGTFPLAPGASATASVRPDTGFKAERILIPAAIAALVSVDSVKVQNQEQLSTPAQVAGQGVNGAAFLATNQDGAGRLSMKYCKETALIAITLTNTSPAPIAAGANVDFQGIAS
jgi:hypothetical protein